MANEETFTVEFQIDAEATVTSLTEVQTVIKDLKITTKDVGDAIDKAFIPVHNRLTKIPYLAQGAVLPANRPFLAMVGDQRHGTNIEAPLATIQEAVALVMQDQTAAILSGVQASVGIQREILEAVLGVQIGDDVIGRRGFCVLGLDPGHRNVCCLRGGNRNT